MGRFKMQADTLNLFAKSEANVWEEAYPLGNGTLGAMVHGGIEKEKISLNHDSLWGGYPRPREFRGDHSALLRAKELVREKKYMEADEVLRTGFSSYASDSYQALGEMLIDFKAPFGKVTRYKRRLELDRAINTVSYHIGKTKITRECFVSHPDKAAVYAVSSEGEKVSFDVTMNSALYSVSYCDLHMSRTSKGMERALRQRNMRKGSKKS